MLNLIIWSREFRSDVIYDSCAEERVLTEQEFALETFLANKVAIESSKKLLKITALIAAC